jgi:cytochrome P450
MEYDPFSPALDDDPYPAYRWLRDRAPLYRNERLGFWAVSRFQDVWQAFGDWRAFSSARGTTPGAARTQAPMILHMDPPEQARLRNLVSQHFTPRRIAALEPEVRALAAACLDPLIGSGGCDIVAALGARLPMDVISALLGIPPADRAQVREWGCAIAEVEDGRGSAAPAALQAAASLGAYFGEQIRERRGRPRDDELMSALVEAGLDDAHAVAFCVLLAGAGGDTTTKFLGNAVVALASHPEQRRRLVAEPGLAPRAVEELLRYEPVAQFQFRWVTREVELHGGQLRRGDWLVLVQGAAARDEREYPEPDRLDLGRAPRRSLSFGRGAHVCLGAHLARLEGRVMLEELHRRFPRYELVEDGLVRAHTTNLRGFRAVPLRF